MWINTLINYFALKEFQEINKRERNVIIWYLSAFSIAEASNAMSLCAIPHVLSQTILILQRNCFEWIHNNPRCTKGYDELFSRSNDSLPMNIALKFRLFSIYDHFSHPPSLKMGILTHSQYSCITFHCWNCSRTSWKFPAQHSTIKMR